MVAAFFCALFSLLLAIPQADASDYTIPQIKVYRTEDLAVLSTFLAYSENFKGGAFVAAGDIDGDGKGEIVTGAGRGGGPHIQFFNKNGTLAYSGFLAFHPDFRGGLSVATGDVNGDGIEEIICAQASTGQAWVKVYNNNQEVLANFLAFPEGFQGGAFVAAGDINGDGKDEIITGAGAGGGPHVRAFDGNGKDTGINFFPYPSDYKGGVTVAAGDVDKDGIDELIVGAASDATARIKIYRADAAKTILAEHIMYPESFQGGVTVAAGDVDGDGVDEIITGAGESGGPHVRGIELNGRLLTTNFMAYHRDFRGGVRVASFDMEGDGRAEIITAPGAKKQTSSCRKGDRCVALTFDDGYSSNGSFERILNSLKKYNAKATFFLLGNAMERNPGLAKRVVDEGHQLANHTYNHPFSTRISAEQLRNEIIQTDELAKRITGKETKPYFRFPYMDFNSATVNTVTALGYKHFVWSASTGDSGSGASADNSYSGALSGLHDGSIILAHTQSNATAAATDRIISSILNAGYKLVTIQELDNREK